MIFFFDFLVFFEIFKGKFLHHRIVTKNCNKKFMKIIYRTIIYRTTHSPPKKFPLHFPSFPHSIHDMLSL